MVTTGALIHGDVPRHLGYPQTNILQHCNCWIYLGCQWLNDKSIARKIINLAHNLNLEVIAKGVETEGQFNLLHKWVATIFRVGTVVGLPLC